MERACVQRLGGADLASREFGGRVTGMEERPACVARCMRRRWGSRGAVAAERRFARVAVTKEFSDAGHLVRRARRRLRILLTRYRSRCTQGEH